MAQKEQQYTGIGAFYVFMESGGFHSVGFFIPLPNKSNP